MSLDKKAVREIVGFTFDNAKQDPNNWMSQAEAFKDAAILIAKSNDERIPFPYYYNAGLSLELIMKAIAVAKNIEFSMTHNLVELGRDIGLDVTKDQEATLELFSELVLWSSRYPIPKREGNWNNYHDVVMEKYKVREQNGNSGKVMINPQRFPSLNNFMALWELCILNYNNVCNANA